jgi:hypothetical protein
MIAHKEELLSGWQFSLWTRSTLVLTSITNHLWDSDFCRQKTIHFQCFHTINDASKITTYAIPCLTMSHHRRCRQGVDQDSRSVHVEIYFVDGSKQRLPIDHKANCESWHAWHLIGPTTNHRRASWVANRTVNCGATGSKKADNNRAYLQLFGAQLSANQKPRINENFLFS